MISIACCRSSLTLLLKEQIAVENSLEIDDTEKPTVLVFNKIDAFNYTVKDEDDLT